jgi:hypothetical protein
MVNGFREPAPETGSGNCVRPPTVRARKRLRRSTPPPRSGNRRPGSTRDRPSGRDCFQPSRVRQSARRIERRDFVGANSRGLIWPWRVSLLLLLFLSCVRLLCEVRFCIANATGSLPDLDRAATPHQNRYNSIETTKRREQLRRTPGMKRIYFAFEFTAGSTVCNAPVLRRWIVAMSSE